MKREYIHINPLTLLEVGFGHQLQSVFSNRMNNYDAFHSFFGHTVFRLWRYDRIDFSMDKTIGFQLTKLGGQHFVRNMFDTSLQFAIPHHFIFQTPHYGHFPSTTYSIHSELDRIVVRFSVIIKIWHSVKILKTLILSKKLVSYKKVCIKPLADIFRPLMYNLKIKTNEKESNDCGGESEYPSYP